MALCLVRKMLAVLRSRCRIFIEWMYCSARAICTNLEGKGKGGRDEWGGGWNSDGTNHKSSQSQRPTHQSMTVSSENRSSSSRACLMRCSRVPPSQ